MDRFSFTELGQSMLVLSVKVSLISQGNPLSKEVANTADLDKNKWVLLMAPPPRFVIIIKDNPGRIQNGVHNKDSC